jgi:hypothetical protein
MLLSGHGKPSGSTERFRGVRRSAFASCATAARRSSSGRSGAGGGRTSAVRQSLGGATATGWNPSAEESRACGAASAFASRRPAPDRERSEARTGGARLRHRSLDFVAGSAPDRAGMRGEISPRAGVAHPAPVGMELPASGGTGAGARRRKDSAVEAAALAGD